MARTATLDHGGYATRRKRWADMSPAEREDARRQSREQGKEKAAAAIERLDQAVERIVSDDAAFAEYLRVSGRMHSYSWGNRLLIALQRPDTAMVAGFHRWKELGRPVRKGSKGVQVLAPMTSKAVDVDESSGEESARVVVRGFRVAYVFAVEDTDGRPIGVPRPMLPEDDGADARDLALRIERTCAAFAVPIELPTDDPALGTGSDGRPAGYWRPDNGTGTIRVNGNLPAAHRAAVIMHELAHALAEHRSHADDRRDAEAVAEGAALVVAAHFGIDTTGYSAPYIAGWAQDLARVRRLLERIAEVSGLIISQADQLGGCPVCGWDGVADGGGCEACR
jgi:N-terminal domain of anti-restriction factor ArdC/IrrE N-terminal-like domain